MKKAPDCLLLGGGGHALVLIDAIRAAGIFVSMGILDADTARHGGEVAGVPVLGGDDQLESLRRAGAREFVAAVGSASSTDARARLFVRALAAGLKPRTVTHPTAVVSPLARIGDGCQLMAGCIVGPLARLGVNVLVNSSAVVEHECDVGDHSHVASGAVLCGGVRVGAGAHVGAGSVVRQGIQVGAGALIGAGAAVVRDVPPGARAWGVPASLKGPGGD